MNGDNLKGKNSPTVFDSMIGIHGDIAKLNFHQFLKRLYCFYPRPCTLFP